MIIKSNCVPCEELMGVHVDTKIFNLLHHDVSDLVIAKVQVE